MTPEDHRRARLTQQFQQLDIERQRAEGGGIRRNVQYGHVDPTTVARSGSRPEQRQRDRDRFAREPLSYESIAEGPGRRVVGIDQVVYVPASERKKVVVARMITTCAVIAFVGHGAVAGHFTPFGTLMGPGHRTVLDFRQDAMRVGGPLLSGALFLLFTYLLIPMQLAVEIRRHRSSPANVPIIYIYALDKPAVLEMAEVIKSELLRHVRPRPALRIRKFHVRSSFMFFAYSSDKCIGSGGVNAPVEPRC